MTIINDNSDGFLFSTML